MLKKISQSIFIILIIFLINFFTSQEIKADECKDACEITYPVDETLRKNCKENCDALKKKIEKAEDYRKLIEQKEKQGEKISDQIEYINQQQNENQQNLVKIGTQIKTLAEKIEDLEKDIEQKEKDIKHQRVILSGLMQSYYDYDRQGILEVVLLNDAFTTSMSQSDYVEQSEMKVSEILDEIKETQQKLIENKKELEGDYEQSAKLKDRLQYEKNSLQLTENQKQSLLTQTQAEKEKYEKLLASIEDEIYDLESGKFVDYSNVPAAKGGYFNYPLSTVRITQGYGMTSFAKAGAYGGKPHNGVDFGISSGNNVFAVKEGKVVKIGNNGRYAYGKWIAIDHGDGLITLYGHLTSQLVSSGDKVKAGEKIGRSGNTGFSTGPHLHFSVFTSKSFETVESKYVKNLMIPIGASINPMRYLK